MEYSRLVKVYEELSSTSKLLEKRDILSNFLMSVKDKDLINVINLLQGRTFSEVDSHKLGVGTQIIIKSLAATSGNSDKEIKKLWVDIGDLGKVVEKIMIKKEQETLISTTLTIQGVIDRNLSLIHI